ncbi:two pore domain potassium channel [Sarracenia purpurea var. burkii]
MFQHIESRYLNSQDFKFNRNEYNESTRYADNLNIFCNRTVEKLWHYAISEIGLNEADFKNSVQAELMKYQEQVVLGVKYMDYDGIVTYPDRWTISAAFLYCLTVITTIVRYSFLPFEPSIQQHI